MAEQSKRRLRALSRAFHSQSLAVWTDTVIPLYPCDLAKQNQKHETRGCARIDTAAIASKHGNVVEAKRSVRLSRLCVRFSRRVPHQACRIFCLACVCVNASLPKLRNLINRNRGQKKHTEQEVHSFLSTRFLTRFHVSRDRPAVPALPIHSGLSCFTCGGPWSCQEQRTMVIGIRFTHHAAISVLQLYDQREQRHTASYTVSPTWCLDVRMNTLLTLADHARLMCSACHSHMHPRQSRAL